MSLKKVRLFPMNRIRVVSVAAPIVQGSTEIVAARETLTVLQNRPVTPPPLVTDAATVLSDVPSPSMGLSMRNTATCGAG
jgi:hypothetical protein